MKENQNDKSNPDNNRDSKSTAKPIVDSSKKGIVSTSPAPTKSTPATENCDDVKQPAKKGGL